MKPVQEILNRIRWDADFANHQFQIAYYDRLEHELITIEFAEARFSPEDHFGFEIIAADGITHSIPYHRVKAIYQDGNPIWQRSN